MPAGRVDQLAVSDGIGGIDKSYDYIKEVRSQTLSVTADVRASQIAMDLTVYRDLARSVSTRINIQNLLASFNNGNDTEALQTGLKTDLQGALAGGINDTLLLQAAIFPQIDRLNSGHGPIANATGESAMGTIPLPYDYANGSQVFMGHTSRGYPTSLYPNLTWTQDSNGNTHVAYDDRTLNYDTTIALGPLYLNNQTALMSFTVAIVNNNGSTDVMGWLTVVVDARLFYNAVSNPAGLGKTGEILIVGPPGPVNLFHPDVEPRVALGDANVSVWYVLQPNDNSTVNHRHKRQAANPYMSFPIDDYPAAVDAFSESQAGSSLSTNNEEGIAVAVGYAKVDSNIVDWVVIFEESRGEALAPIHKLRDTILACIFSVFGAVIIICFPLAHYAVKPISALKTATENSIMTYEAEIPDSSSGSQSDPESLKHAEYVTANGLMSEKGCRPKKPKMQRRREFQIPEKVPERRHIINDELTDLTGTFNEMSDELKVQYARLEDRVKKRTAELEKSRDLARAADESKTLFIANVSHELRTPLNGIIGMCSVAMQEDEVPRIRQSINIIYKSSDLLLHLLNDLLTFSRNSYGQQLAIEQSLFRLGDIGTQIVSIFEKQAREKDVSLKVVFQGVLTGTKLQIDDAIEDVIYAKPDVTKMLKRVETDNLASGPGDTGALRDMALIGDKNRILQILMNLVSNSLKFTPANGTIEVRIRCKGFAAATETDHTEISSASTVVASSTPPEKRPTTPQEPRQLKFDFEVEDTGPGIPEHLQKEVFKPFVQGDLALSRKHGGTGLGLAICTQLASLMDGGIHLRSTVDIGSVFTCSIPLRYTEEKVSSVAGSLAPQSRRGSQMPPSINTSFDALPSQPHRPPTRGSRVNPESARVSICSVQEGSPQQLESPRVVGFSHPFLTDGEAKETNESKSAGPGSERQISAKAIRQRLASIQSQDGTADATNDYHRNQTVPLTTYEEKPPVNGAPIEIIDKTPRTSTPRILVAEDNKVNQEVIMRMLMLEKITDVALAEDGVQAVQKVRDTSAAKDNDGTDETRFSLIFMDIQMPNMDGIEATKEIRKMGFEAPIVALTAFDHETNRETCSNAGMTDFVGKPLKRKALKEVLEKYGMREAAAGGAKDKSKKMDSL